MYRMLREYISSKPSFGGQTRLQRIKDNFRWDLKHKLKLFTECPMGETQSMNSQRRIAECAKSWFREWRKLAVLEEM